MPLIQGHTKKSLSENIQTLVHEGKTQKQAIAIAFSIARKSKKRKPRRLKRIRIGSRLKRLRG